MYPSEDSRYRLLHSGSLSHFSPNPLHFIS